MTCFCLHPRKTHMEMMVWKECTIKMWPILVTMLSFCGVTFFGETCFCSNLFWRLLLLWNGGSMMQLHTTPWGGAAQVSLASRLIKNGVKASWVSTQNTCGEALNRGEFRKVVWRRVTTFSGNCLMILRMIFGEGGEY